MQIRTLGKDLKVSAVGLGCMGMSHAYGAPADKKEMTELLAEAVDIPFSTPQRYMVRRKIRMTMKNWWGLH